MSLPGHAVVGAGRAGVAQQCPEGPCEGGLVCASVWDPPLLWDRPDAWLFSPRVLRDDKAQFHASILVLENGLVVLSHESEKASW